MLSLPSLNWRAVPMVRLLFSFLFGILLAECDVRLFDINITLFLLALLLLTLSVVTQRLPRRWSPMMGISLMVSFVIVGCICSLQHNEQLNATHFTKQPTFHTDSTYNWTGQVVNIKPTQKKWRLTIAVDGLQIKDQAPLPVTGRLQLHLSGNATSSSLLPGHRVAFQGKAASIAGPKNPATFDAATFFARQNIYHRCWLTDDYWIVLDEKPSIYGYAYQLRERLLVVLRQYLPANSNELAVAAALILGKREELPTDLRDAYAETGAVHVLAVSGLHLAFVTIGLGWLLAWLPRRQKWGRWIYFTLVILGTWAFAFITGMAPSVMRAAVMLTALELGRAIGRRSSTYNTLALSAFLLLFYNPLLLFDIGFQLSYLAVFGIIYFQPPLYRSIYCPNRVLDKVWSLTTVAIAAQLTTFPLSLYYFHQFPVYFLLSSIAVVILAQLVLGLGIVLFVSAFLLPVVASVCGQLLYGCLIIMNGIIESVRALPGHLLAGIWINGWILFLLALSVLSLALFIAERRKQWLWTTLTLLLLSTGVYSWGQIQSVQQHQLIIYHQYKGSIVDAFNGRTRLTISTLPEDDQRLRWTAAPYRQKHQTEKVNESPHWLAKSPIYGFYDQRIAIVDTSFQLTQPPPSPLAIDILLLRSSPRISLQSLQDYFQARHWVIDGSNYPSRVEQWLLEAAVLDLKTVHYTARDGAFIHSF